MAPAKGGRKSCPDQGGARVRAQDQFRGRTGKCTILIVIVQDNQVGSAAIGIETVLVVDPYRCTWFRPYVRGLAAQLDQAPVEIQQRAILLLVPQHRQARLFQTPHGLSLAQAHLSSVVEDRRLRQSELAQRRQFQPPRIVPHTPQETIHVVVVQKAGQHQLGPKVGKMLLQRPIQLAGRNGLEHKKTAQQLQQMKVQNAIHPSRVGTHQRRSIGDFAEDRRIGLDCADCGPKRRPEPLGCAMGMIEAEAVAA